MSAADRARGALYGLAIGDALGMPAEMLSREQIVSRWGPQLVGFEPAPPGHPLADGMSAGAVTDDTEQAVLLARLLVKGEGTIDTRELADALVSWEQDMTARGSRSLLGPSTKRALDAIRCGVPPEEAGAGGATNGAAMRITPVGIAFAATAPGADESRLSGSPQVAAPGADEGRPAGSPRAAGSDAAAGSQHPDGDVRPMGGADYAAGGVGQAAGGVGQAAGGLSRLVDHVVEASMVTHNTSVALAGAAAVAAAVSVGIGGASVAGATETGITAARLASCRGHWIAGADVAARIRWATGLVKDAGPDRAAELIGTLVGTSLATQESVPAAFAVLSAVPDDPWRACLLAASLGGDTDTIAAMAGAIAGACHGKSAFPPHAIAAIDAHGFALPALADALLALRQS